MDVVKKIAKSLASNQQKVRWRAQKQVAVLLSKSKLNGKSDWTYEQMLGICKGLHYSLWMQDKLLLKEQTVTRICNILLRIQDNTTILYYSYAMFETIAREWDKLDYWRVDKFLLLAREFFTIGLQYISYKKPEVLEPFIEAIFTKVLNKDTDHAVGLKMHFCTLISEELPKKKVKMSSVQSIFKQLLLLLPLLPRHNTYAHSILSLATQITKLVKRRPQCCLDGVLECLDNISISECPYRNALKRINANLKKLISFREAKSKANDEETPTQFVKQIHETSSTVPIDSQNLNSKGNLRKLKSKKMTKKAVSKKKKVVRKRVFPEATDQCDADSTHQAEDVVHESCPKRMKLQTNTESENTINSDIPSHPNETSTVLTDESKPNIDCFTSPNVLVDMSEQEKHVAYTPLSSERRVSFGKVFRKKFSATRCISLTPPVSVIPAKGILRGNKSFPEEARVNVSF